MIRPAYLSDEAINHFIDSALQEDIRDGDHSTLSTIPEDLVHRASLLVKDDGIIAGIELAGKIFKRFDHRLRITSFVKDGDPVRKGEVAFDVEGPARSIMTTERLVLNCLQRMSGIATYTNRLNKIIEGTNARLMDTRKTTPNFRLMEKWAVAIGGGLNHRFALYDMIMLKDNHVDLAGGISPALMRAHEYLRRTGKNLKIEIETRSLREVEDVIEAGGADVIMLDNMSTQDMKTAVLRIGGRYKTEASGGITENNLAEVAACGVDYISIGALTHSVKSLDLSLKVKNTAL